MMKFKPNQTRTYDGEGFIRRAACLCFKNEKEDEVLLVSSARHPDQWIVPGGGMEPEEEPCGAAVREVFEEPQASVRGDQKGCAEISGAGCYRRDGKSYRSLYEHHSNNAHQPTSSKKRHRNRNDELS